MEGRRPGDGPMRQRVRARAQARAGMAPPEGLAHGSLEIGELTRTYAVAGSEAGTGPLLVVLHGAGGTGPGMASLTGLHTRGPAAGFVVVFPDGHRRVWNDSRGGSKVR